MPVCRSARARSLLESKGISAAAGASNTKKSLPSPCIFKNSMRIWQWSIAHAPLCREQGLRKLPSSFTLRKTTKPGIHATRDGFELQGRLRQEHFGDQY